MTTVAVVSSLPAVRAGLRALVESAPAGLGVRVVAEGASAASLTGGADVLVLDVEPGTGADDVLPASDLAPGLVLLGALGGEDRFPQALAGRPVALLPRDASREQLQAAIQAVASGLFVVDAATAGQLMAPLASSAASPPAADPVASGGVDGFTGREREVLQLVAEGLPNKSIARRLGISEHTVKFHVGAVMAKLSAGSRTEAVHLAARRGLVSL